MNLFNVAIELNDVSHYYYSLHRSRLAGTLLRGFMELVAVSIRRSDFL